MRLGSTGFETGVNDKLIVIGGTIEERTESRARPFKRSSGAVRRTSENETYTTVTGDDVAK
jgi:hypothetical protein